jgi:D-glycero-alpha-D-manno-heptose-7-phosphate kinase
VALYRGDFLDGFYDDWIINQRYRLELCYSVPVEIGRGGSSMKVSAIVPTRIDLAGGTLDVYPLYLFEDGGLTVNAAVNIYGHVTVEERPDARIYIHSEDTGAEETFASLAKMPMGGDLDLVKRALRFYRPHCGLNVTLRSEAPCGSGLGASSALLMALSSALNEIENLGLSKDRIIDLGANIEAQVIGIPTGKQDYFPPLFGGVCSIWFDVDGHRLEGVCSIWFDVDGHRLERLDEGNDLIVRLNERLILTFTNINRFSGVTNWAILKRYIEKEGDTVAHLRRIKEVARALRQSLVASDRSADRSRRSLDEFARLLAIEWENRKALAEGVTTPEIDAMIAAAEAKGARASKLCGAGGGGCMITYAEPENVPAVREALMEAGATLMPFRIVPEGIRLEIRN